MRLDEDVRSYNFVFHCAEVWVEESWRLLVEGHDQLDERQEQQQSAIWELVETEATYIHMLKVITDVSTHPLTNLVVLVQRVVIELLPSYNLLMAL